MTDQQQDDRDGDVADRGPALHERGSDAAPRGALRITVSRTGGVAGLAPHWSVMVTEEKDVDSWLSLVESCPWDAPAPGIAGEPDRFVYTIRVLQPDHERDARVPERALDGPWADLVARVKDASR